MTMNALLEHICARLMPAATTPRGHTAALVMLGTMEMALHVLVSKSNSVHSAGQIWMHKLTAVLLSSEDTVFSLCCRNPRL